MTSRLTWPYRTHLPIHSDGRQRDKEWEGEQSGHRVSGTWELSCMAKALFSADFLKGWSWYEITLVKVPFFLGTESSDCFRMAFKFIFPAFIQSSSQRLSSAAKLTPVYFEFLKYCCFDKIFFPPKSKAELRGDKWHVSFLSLNDVLHQRLAWVHSFIFQEPTLQYSILFPYSLIRHLQCQPLINWDPKFPTKQWLRELMILALVILNPVCAYSQHCHTVSIDWIESRLSINSQVPQGARVASNLFQS